MAQDEIEITTAADRDRAATLLEEILGAPELLAAPSDLLHDIIAALQTITNSDREKLAASPEFLAVFLDQQRALVDLALNLSALGRSQANSQPPGAPPAGLVDKGGGGGDDGPMEARITALEKDMTVVKTDVAVIRSNYATREDLAGVRADVAAIRTNYATKEDLQKELNASTWKIIGAIAALTTAVFFLARYTPDSRPPAAAQPTPQVQAAPAAATPPPATPSTK